MIARCPQFFSSSASSNTEVKPQYIVVSPFWCKTLSSGCVVVIRPSASGQHGREQRHESSDQRYGGTACCGVTKHGGIRQPDHSSKRWNAALPATTRSPTSQPRFRLIEQFLKNFARRCAGGFTGSSYLLRQSLTGARAPVYHHGRIQ